MCFAASSKEISHYNGIDICKFICSILVVAIHIPVVNAPMTVELSNVSVFVNTVLQQAMCRIAVPFFFVCSGFFLYKKCQNKQWM